MIRLFLILFCPDSICSPNQALMRSLSPSIFVVIRLPRPNSSSYQRPLFARRTHTHQRAVNRASECKPLGHVAGHAPAFLFAVATIHPHETLGCPAVGRRQLLKRRQRLQPCLEKGVGTLLHSSKLTSRFSLKVPTKMSLRRARTRSAAITGSEYYSYPTSPLSSAKGEAQSGFP